tara:strand:- start:2171 stop:2776 length:606 start_codon:yes stop_codon:yes gene_type:complete
MKKLKQCVFYDRKEKYSEKSYEKFLIKNNFEVIRCFIEDNPNFKKLDECIIFCKDNDYIFTTTSPNLNKKDILFITKLYSSRLKIYFFDRQYPLASRHILKVLLEQATTQYKKRKETYIKSVKDIKIQSHNKNYLNERSKKTKEFRKRIFDEIQSILKVCKTDQEIADVLNKKNIKSYTNKRWTRNMISNLKKEELKDVAK